MVNASRALLKKHHLFSETSWCNSSTSDCWSEGCVIKSLRGQVISYWHEMSNMKNAFFVTGYIWIFIYRLFFLAIRSLKKMETWMPKLKPISFEPELNQRPKDSHISSTVLRSTNWAIEGLDATTTHKKFRKPDLLGFLREIQAAFCGKCIKASTQEAPPFRLRPRGTTVASLTPDQKVLCSNHVGVRWSLIGVKRLIWTVFFLSGDTKSEENGNVNAKVKTNLLRAWIEPAI